MINVAPSLVYISGRPFVLRHASEPRQTLSLSDRAENLEAIELRLKNDILQEAARCGISPFLPPIRLSSYLNKVWGTSSNT